MAKRLSKTPSFQVYAGDELRQSWWLASDTATSLYWRLAIRSHDSDQRGTIPFPSSDSDYVVLSKSVSMTVESTRAGLEELVTLGAVSVTKGRKTIVIPTVKNDEEKKLNNRVKNQKTYHKSNSENKNLTKFIRDKSEINPPSSISSSSSLSSSNSTPPNPPPGGEREDEPPDKQKRVSYSESFQAFWEVYPLRNGARVGKVRAYRYWVRLGLNTDESLRDAVMEGLGGYKLTCGNYPKDAERFLRDRLWESDFKCPRTTQQEVIAHGFEV